MMKNRIHVCLFLSLIFVGQPVVSDQGDKPPTDFDRAITASKVGKIMLRYKEVGEPVSKPAWLNISVQCDGMKQFKPVDAVGMCNIKDYEYDQQKKSLRLTFVSARVAAGSKVVCDQQDEKTFDIGKFCTDLWRKKLGK